MQTVVRIWDIFLLEGVKIGSLPVQCCGLSAVVHMWSAVFRVALYLLKSREAFFLSTCNHPQRLPWIT